MTCVIFVCVRGCLVKSWRSICSGCGWENGGALISLIGCYCAKWALAASLWPLRYDRPYILVAAHMAQSRPHHNSRQARHYNTHSSLTYKRTNLWISFTFLTYGHMLLISKTFQQFAINLSYFFDNCVWM